MNAHYARARRFAVPALVILGLLVVGLYLCLFRINEWQQGIVFRFREVSRPDVQPGVHFLIPGINRVEKFESRLLYLDQEPQRYLTLGKKAVIVDYYVKWRIIDTVRFYEATRGDIRNANNLLAQRVNRTLRDEFAKRTVQQVVASERTEMLQLTTSKTAGLQNDLGIEVVDVRTKRIDLPKEVSEKVYERMRSERLRAAKEYRAEGAEAAERIRATAERERAVILADAYRDAQIIRGEGDAKATEIYAGAYERDREFFALYRSLSAYQNSFSGGNDILLLGPDSDFFKYFNRRFGE